MKLIYHGLRGMLVCVTATTVRRFAHREFDSAVHINHNLKCLESPSAVGTNQDIKKITWREILPNVSF